jgi:hypothetical protein
MLVGISFFYTIRREQLVALAAQGALPTIYGQREYWHCRGAGGAQCRPADRDRSHGDTRLPDVARQVLQVLACQIEHIEAAITALERQLLAWHKSNPISQRLASIPGIGPIIATAIATTVADPHPTPPPPRAGAKGTCSTSTSPYAGSIFTQSWKDGRDQRAGLISREDLLIDRIVTIWG